MTALWIVVLASGAAVVIGEMVILDRQRRAFVADPARARVFMRVALGRQDDAGAPPIGVQVAREAAAPPELKTVISGAPDHPPLTHAASEGVIYVSPDGECTYASPMARDLLRWRTGSVALADVLAGGSGESAELLASLARQGVVDHHATMIPGPLAQAVQVRALALRDRDDNFWGAALFVRRLPPARRG